MAVYITPIVPCKRNNDWRWSEVSHLLADTIAELHAFAVILGLKRKWYQPKSSPHYDLTENKFYKALELGATILMGKDYLDFRSKHRT